MARLKSLFQKDANTLKGLIKTTGLTGIILVSLVVSFCVGFFDSYVMVAIPFMLLVGLYLFNRLLVQKKKGGVSLSLKKAFKFSDDTTVRHLWVMALVGLFIGFIQAKFSMLNLIDLIVIGGCVLVILDAPDSEDAYRPLLKIFTVAAVFFAISVWIQVLLPGVYKLYLYCLQDTIADRIAGYRNYFTGFTTNPSHTSTYITLGIFALASSSRFAFKKENWKTLALMAFLAGTILCVGMRMPMVSMCLGVATLVFFRTTPQQRKRICLVLLIAAAVALLVAVLFHDQLYNAIPMYRRTYGTIIRLITGRDFTSGRTDLYGFAIEKFLSSPFFGIGWGNYRLAVKGAVTESSNFDVHSIYLQLLCETGLFGFACFMVPFGYFLYKTLRIYNQLKTTAPGSLWEQLMAFSMMFQLYFLSFGITDNTLYSTCEQIPYLICCGMVVTYLCCTQSKGIDRRRNKKGKRV